ncbi:MAG TPA: hypothetical protein VK914_03770 [bacterium]|jgi:hypothetical protein|nr:hypothetical protein [bacterium]
MQNGRVRTAAFAALGVLCLGAGTARAGVRRDVDEIKHALGWDTLTMTTINEDKAGRPTLERDGNLVNRVERRTDYFANGKKSEQTVEVTSKHSKKTLFTEKSVWSEDGAPVGVTIEDDAFNGDGRQMAGRIDDQQYSVGRLTHEVTKEYSAGTGQWGDTSRRTVSYFDDGDMKVRLTEFPASDEKTRETWGAKDGVLGRDKSTETWNSSRGAWN